ncbi:uncharacterized protein LOC128860884 [Anastrepha ludens]|uniref:uncharacterized protein LOC128860884 n=1 Tax=Anastrepha ludens TaxID=28586 RepID=UPI0023B0572A|nr:uncharacterized protein LOC128860884 [Anastrepha ludens]
MKLTTSLLLLVAGLSCLFEGCAAGVSVIPQNAIDDLKYRDQSAEPIAPVNVDEEIVPIFERSINVEPINGGQEDYVEPAPIAEVEAASVESKSEVEDESVKPESDANEILVGRASECKVAIRGGLSSPQPVYIKKGSTEFYPYDDSGVMVVDSGSSLEMWCPGKFSSISQTLVTATCVSGTNFKIDGTTYAFKELACKAWPTFTAEKTGASCNGGIMVRVGYKVSSSRFIEQYTVCFDEVEEVTRYVHHDLNPGSNYYETGVARITFTTGGFFDGKAVNTLYTQVTQQETISAALGMDSSKYFDYSTSLYLARGHLAAKADFDYAAQQRASFLFINAAPQWQTFNAGNWASVEDSLRSKVTKSKWTVDCYTGVYGVTTLPNSEGVQTPLYLAYDNNNNGLIPVPKLYFRVVIERSTNKGIVFIGVNNPYLTLDEIKKDYIICTDVADQVDYITWKRTDITAGYSYACTVSDFMSKVSHLPSLSASGGLLL